MVSLSGEFFARADIVFISRAIDLRSGVRRKSIRLEVKGTPYGGCFGTLSRGQKR